MSIDPENNQSQNDRTLSKLYKNGATESPNAQLDQKILNYAASNKHVPNRRGSHFGGGWKVPLSLAASVLLVFTILLQLDKHPEQLPVELPPLPTANKPDAGAVPTPPNNGLEDNSRLLNESVEADANTVYEAEESLDELASPASAPAVTESKVEARKKSQQSNKQGTISRPEAALEKIAPSESVKLNTQPTPQKTPQGSQELHQDSAKELQGKAKRSTTQEFSRTITNSPTELSKDHEIQDSISKEAMPQNQEAASVREDKSDFTPLASEKWLSSIEELITEKNYAEATFQLDAFKKTYPNIDVQNLESKIP